MSDFSRRRVLAALGTVGAGSLAGCVGDSPVPDDYEACPTLVAHQPTVPGPATDRGARPDVVTAFGVGVRGTTTIERMGFSHAIDVANWATVATVHTVIGQAEGALYIPQTIAAISTPRITVLRRDRNPIREHTVRDIGEQFVGGLTSAGDARHDRALTALEDRLIVSEIDDATPRAIFEAFRSNAPHWIPFGRLETRIDYAEPWPATDSAWRGETWRARAEGTLVGVDRPAPFELRCAMRQWADGDDFVIGLVLEPTTAFRLEATHARELLDRPELVSPRPTDVASPVASIADQFETSPLTPELSHLGIDGPILVHDTGCNGEAEDQVADYTVSSDDILALLEFLVSQCAHGRVFIRGWWALAPPDVEILVDPFAGLVHLYWLDENGVACHGEPGVSGQPGSHQVYAQDLDVFGHQDDTIPDDDFEDFEGPPLDLGDYTAPGPHFAQVALRRYRLREDGMVLTTAGVAHFSIPSIVHPDDRPVCLMPMRDFEESCDGHGLPVPSPPDTPLDRDDEPEQHPEYGHERTFPTENMPLDERRGYCYVDLVADR